jgi:hypothetical protein
VEQAGALHLQSETISPSPGAHLSKLGFAKAMEPAIGAGPMLYRRLQVWQAGELPS